jgi:hypothetical protein
MGFIKETPWRRITVTSSLNDTSTDQLRKMVSWWWSVGEAQGVTKRCRLSLFTNSALVYESKCGGREGGSCGLSANEYSCAHHVIWSPNKLSRSTSIFNLWRGVNPFYSGLLDRYFKTIGTV